MTDRTEPADLAAWLRVQLDEDERVARGAHGGWGPRGHQWRYDPQHRTALYGNISIYPERDPHGYHTTTAEHLVRHDPARVLAEVEAKRRILDWAVRAAEVTEEDCYNLGCEDLVRLLAEPYASQPGYDERWRP